MSKIPGRLGQAVERGTLTESEALTVMSYPRAHERFEERGGNPRRYVNVSKQWLREQQRLELGEPRPHFTRYNPLIIDAVAERIGESKMILDPMAGTLERLACLEKPERGYHLVWGVEYEPEWVRDYPHPRLVQGDARRLPFESEFFDVVCVSPSYGNRDSDRTGEWWDNADRKTYASALGRNVSDGSLCVPFTDLAYKRGHALAWAEAVRVLKPNGLFVINLKNFIRNHTIMRMSQWHREVLRDGLGLVEIDDTSVPTKGRPSGANSEVRAENVEKIYIYLRSEESRSKTKALKKAVRKGLYDGKG